MIEIKRTFIAVFIMLWGGLTLLPADSNQDILPLGPSEFKFLIDKIEPDQILRTGSGKPVSLADIIDQNPDTDVFIIGEAHDNFQCHTFQRDFIDALFKKYPKIIVGFEFFRREDNEILEQFRIGQISEADFIKNTGWYQRGSQNYGFTRLVMDTLVKYRVKTIGLNVPRSILRTVSRKGFSQLSPDEKKLFPTLNIPNPEHEYFIKSIFGTFAAQVPAWFDNIYTAQKCWDVVMAESLRQTLAQKEYKGFKGVIIAGSNHVAFQLGIPFRYRKADPKIKITTIIPILIPEEKKADVSRDEEPNPMMKMMAASLKPAAIFSRGIADYVFAAYQPLQPHFPAVGFSVEEKEGKLIITAVSKNSLAEQNGFRIGDQVTAIDGTAITNLEQLRLLIAQKNWDESISFGVIKNIVLKKPEK